MVFIVLVVRGETSDEGGGKTAVKIGAYCDT